MSQKSKIPDQSTALCVGEIPEKVTHLNGQERNYLLSFKFYNEKLCEIDHLSKNIPKECIRVLKRASQSRVGDLQSKNIDEIPVRMSGEYKQLYNRLTMDVQIYEHKIQSTARLFYFVTTHEFNVVAITHKHFETDKKRS